MRCGDNPCCNSCDCRLVLRRDRDVYALYVKDTDGIEELGCHADQCGAVTSELALKHRHALTGRVLTADELAALKKERGSADPNAWVAPDHRILMESARDLEPGRAPEH